MSIKKLNCENYLFSCQVESNGIKLRIKILLICIRNIGLKGKNWKTTFQEEANGISLCQFSKMSRWGGPTSIPTNVCCKLTFVFDDYE